MRWDRCINAPESVVISGAQAAANAIVGPVRRGSAGAPAHVSFAVGVYSRSLRVPGCSGTLSQLAGVERDLRVGWPDWLYAVLRTTLVGR